MLTPKQYESLGILSLTFNHLEDMLERIIECYLSGGTHSRLVKAVAAEGNFSQKAARFRRLLRAFREDHPELAAEIDVVRGFLTDATQVAEKRNAYMHALATYDVYKDETRLIIKGVETVCDEEEIIRLDREIMGVHAQLGSTAFELFRKTMPSK
jgi:hypothetical protein